MLKWDTKPHYDQKWLLHQYSLWTMATSSLPVEGRLSLSGSVSMGNTWTRPLLTALRWPEMKVLSSSSELVDVLALPSE